MSHVCIVSLRRVMALDNRCASLAGKKCLTTVEKRESAKPGGMSLRLIVQNDAEKGTVDFYSTIVVNEA